MTGPTVAERLAAKSAPAAGGCIVFTGATLQGSGYGRLRVGTKTVGAHRVAWELTHGPIPEGLFVCHRCDNRPCVNTQHLFLGTHDDNMADMARKGRARSPRVGKLTMDSAAAIRRAHVPGVPLRHLAEEHGVSVATISRVVNGRIWAP